MIRIFESNTTDFSTNGLGVLSPYECTVTETLNGQYELTLKHHRDEQRKIDKITAGRIIVAPVPAAKTPRVEISVPGEDTRKNIYKINTQKPRATARGGNLRIWGWNEVLGTAAGVYGAYDNGTEVQLIAQTSAYIPAEDSYWWEVMAPDGKHGWMNSYFLDYVRTEGSVREAINSVIEPTQIREQPFRIYRVIPTLDGITVYARHLQYDLMDNMVLAYSPSSAATGAEVLQGIKNACLDSTSLFRFYSDITATASDVSFKLTNPIEAILNSRNGFITYYGGEIARDWRDLYVVNRIGEDTQVTIREKKNLLGVKYDVDYTSVITRVIPTGSDENGDTMFLPETYVDSTHRSEYPHDMLYTMTVTDASVNADRTAAQCYEKMRAEAQKLFTNGNDIPKITLTVDFVQLENTEEYKDYAALESLFIGDSVRVISESMMLDTSARVTQYTFDCLMKRYSSMSLGSVAGTINTISIGKTQISNGAVTSYAISGGAVGTAQLQSASVGSAQIKLAAIETANIHDAAITTAKIGDAQITTAKINDAAITTAKIDALAVTDAKIGNAAVTTAKIHDAAITTAKLGEASVEEAKIANLAVTNGKIANATITGAKIASATIEGANIANATIATANIANGAITTALIANAAVQEANIDTAAITTAKIANGAITTAKIGNAQVDTANIANAAITTALVADAAITSAKIVSVNADTITTGTLATERLLITGTDGVVYEINAESGSLTAAELSEEKYRQQLSGTVLVAKSVTADQIAAQSITAAEIATGTITTNQVTSTFGAGLDISSNNSITTLTGTVNSNWTSIQQTATEIRASVNTVAQTANAAASVAGNVTDWMTFGANGLTIGKTGNNFSMNLTNTQLAFRDGNTDMVWIRNNEANIRNLRAENSFRINGYTFEDTGAALVIR